jgi:circadian clock protein KaiC
VGDLTQHLEAIAHGVFYVEQLSRDYGPIRRRIMILKLRRRAYRSGWHDFRIEASGTRIFPTLISGEHRKKKRKELLSSGNEQLDALLCGGLNRGSSTAVVGASGTGKTSLSNLFAVAAARRGEHAAIYLFDETDESFLERAEGMGLGIDAFIEEQRVTLRQINVAELSPGEFIHMVRQEVEEKGARVVVIDTLSGYGSSMPEEKHLTLQLHELLVYLSQNGVTTFLVVEQHGIFGTQQEVKDVSYLADTILLLRYFEHKGQVRRAISVIKKRRGKHQTDICELSFSDKGIHIGQPLKQMHGVLTGVPTLES